MGTNSAAMRSRGKQQITASPDVLSKRATELAAATEDYCRVCRGGAPALRWQCSTISEPNGTAVRFGVRAMGGFILVGHLTPVMAALVAAIHVFGVPGKDVDGRDEPGHDDEPTNLVVAALVTA